jgi:5-methylthioadenosine/S-adenosylhomocysteine deaminase
MEQIPAMPREIDILIEHGVVIPMDEPEHILYDGSVAVDKGRIVEVGPAEELAGRFAPKRRIDARKRAVLPGFVDTHHHCLQNLLKGSRDDCTLADWIDNVSAPRIVMAVGDYLRGNYELQYHATRVGCAEALRSGITTLLNMEWATDPSLLDIYEQAGIRAIHTLTMTDYDQWNRPGMIMPLDKAFALAEALIARAKASKDGMIHFRYGLACPNSCTTGLMQEVRRRATEQGVAIHIHIAETEFEWNNIHQRYGKTPVQYLRDIGLLGPDVLGAHCIWLNEEDIRILRETGTSVAHCPECNMKIADGAAPVAEMLAAGVTVSLATDSCAVNDNMDMFEAARVAAFLQKLRMKEACVLPAYQALELATVGGAKALGLEAEIGTLAPGKRADIILVDLTAPHLRPINNIVNNLVYCASAPRDVVTVIVNGRLVMENGELLTMNVEEVYTAAEKYIVRRFSEAGLYVSPYYRFQRD